MKIVSIGGSNSKDSINRKLANYTASLLSNEIDIVDISMLKLPIYSIDLENENGIPEIVLQFATQIDESDLIVISLAENNGSYNVGFKNLMDWTSRIKNRKTWNDKRMLLMATSPGARGGMNVLEHAKSNFPRMGATIIETYSLPSFQANFSLNEGIVNPEEKKRLMDTLERVKTQL
jgi:chromate reductase